MVKLSIDSGLFLAGLVLVGINAVAAGALGVAGLALLSLVGLAVGVMNVTKGERVAYMIATIVLFVVSFSIASVVNVASVGPMLDTLFDGMVVFFGLAAIPVALMTAWKIAGRK